MTIKRVSFKKIMPRASYELRLTNGSLSHETSIQHTFHHL